MSRIVLRPDQEAVRDALRVALRSKRSVLAYACTGFGKTVLSSFLIDLIARRGKRVIFAVHRKALLRQTAVTFEKFNIPFSFIAAGHTFNPLMPVQIASIPTLVNRLGDYGADYVFVDEAHLSMAAGWKRVVEHYRQAGSRLIGLTGSPVRLDGKPLGDVWETMVEGPSMRSLIEQGNLASYRAFSPRLVETAGLHRRKGDYIVGELEDLMTGRAVLANTVRHWAAVARHKRTIAFSPSIRSAHLLAGEYRARGISCVALDGDSSDDTRREAFRDFARDRVQVLVNVNLFTEGFDLAAQVDRDVVIECVNDASPTNSLARHLQKHGRGLRADGTGEPHILIDQVGAFMRPDLGLPDEAREWSLTGVPVSRSRSGSGQGERVSLCEKCYAAYEPAPRCPVCGHIKPVRARRVREIEGELEEVDLQARRRDARMRQGQAGSLKDLVLLARRRGYKSPEKWAAHVWTARQAKAKGKSGNGRKMRA